MTTAGTTRLRPSRWFFVDGSGPRSRRPVDVAMVVVGVLLVVASAGSADNPGPLQQSILDAAHGLPTWAINLFSATYALSAVYLVVVVGAVMVTAPRRGSLPLAVTAAVAISFVAAVLAALVVEDGWPEIQIGVVSEGTHGGFPTLRVAVMTGVLMVLRPWIVVSFRRLNAMIVTIECVAAWAVGIAGLPDIIGALGLGMAASGVVLISLGSPGGHPDLAQVSAALDDLGVRVLNLRFAERQPWGVRVLLGESEAGQPLLVKVYGRDATDAQIAARLWRSLVYTDERLATATRLQLVEHEALVTILAERGGAAVSRVVAAAAAREGDAVLVLDLPPPSFAEAADEELSDALLLMWLEVEKLHALDICHGELTLDHVGADRGRVVISDFSTGSLGSSLQTDARDVATLLTSQALRTGPDRAVNAAVDVLGGEPVAAAQPYLQRAALPRSLRGAPELRSTLTDLRQAVSSRTGVEPAALAQVARVSWRDLLQTGVVLLAAYVLLTLVTEIDWETVFRSWADATWGWILLALVVVQGTVVADSVSTMSWASARLPLWPVMMLQYSIKMVGMAFSATAGRVALNTAFLRRFGMNPTEAVTGTALDSVADWILKILIVILALVVVGGQRFHVDTSPGSDDTLVRLVVMLLIAALVTIVVVVSVPRLRRRVSAVIRNSWAAARVVTASPSRGFLLLGSNLASLMITAAALYCNVRSMHGGLSYDTILVVTTVAALLTSVLPSPGNVGVGEAAIAASLVAVGVPSGPAFAIAVTQRICTSYLPPVIGAFAIRWLRRQDYLA